jgi:hypothetical protein
LAGGALQTSVQDPETAKIPDRFYLADNYPNPFNPQTTIRYQLPVTTPIKIEIYNILGKRVRTLIDRVQQSGEHYIRWDTKDDFGHPVASGVYIYRMQVESTERFVDFKKMLLLR